MVSDVANTMCCRCSVGSKSRVPRGRRHTLLQTVHCKRIPALQLSNHQSIITDILRHVGCSQNSRAHSWECLMQAEYPHLGSLGKQRMSHIFGHTLYFMREPEGTHAKRLCAHCIRCCIHSLFATSHLEKKRRKKFPSFSNQLLPPHTHLLTRKSWWKQLLLLSDLWQGHLQPGPSTKPLLDFLQSNRLPSGSHILGDFNIVNSFLV